ncbi:MAG: serine hydrolase [Chloroflexi bacterium]|nr:serine hydrolase [Chloroflexota bacterium]MQG58259.1 beta-lactamase family protein [SAR202 cluster bacterium]
MQTAAPEEVGFSSKRLGRLDDVMQGYVDAGMLAGIVTMLARRGKVFHFKPFGLMDIYAVKPVELDTIFRIYSMSKPITSAAVMMLYEEGAFHLDEPVSRFIPELADLKVFAGMSQKGKRLVDPDRPISIRHLLTHTSGLSYGSYVDTPVDDMYRSTAARDPDDNLQGFIERIAEIPLAYQPGTSWRYSVATDVLGRLVEVISGRTFDQYLKDSIFEPLGMPDTAFYVPEEKLDRLASIYGPAIGGGMQELDTPGVNQHRRPLTMFSGGGGLVSTASDYMRFCQMMLNGGTLDDVRLLGPKTVELMTINHLSDDLMPYSVSEAGVTGTQGCGFGLGFRVVIDLAQHGILGSEGMYSWGGAASTVFWIDPKEELVAILMTQFMPSGQYPIRREFQVATYQAMVD